MGRHKGCIPWNKGIKMWENRKHPNLGRKWSDKTIQKRIKSQQHKIEDLGIGALHKRIKKLKPQPLECEHCKQEKRLELSNKNHKYRTDLDDWEYLCISCHAKYELKMGFRSMKPMMDREFWKERKRNKLGRFINEKNKKEVNI